MKRASTRVTLTACAVIACLSTMPAGAQIPDEFTNLQVLSEDIPKQELIGIMRSWAGGLGVRCNHCHVGPENLQGMDFASDDKEEKRAARVMAEMSRTINQQVGSWDEGGDHQSVSCFTCHRGQPEPPRRLTGVLSEIVLSEGVDAAIARYRELREEHYGAGLYDFSEKAFSQLGQAVFEARRLDLALEILESSLEFYPDSPNLNAFLGMALMQNGRPEEAAAQYEKALELDPENAPALRGKMMLERAKSEEGGG